MNSGMENLRRRLCVLARAPGFTADALARLAAESPDFALIDRPERAALVQLGLTTSVAAWLAAPDQARVEADLRWLDDAGCALLPATATEYPQLLRHSPDAPAVLHVRGSIAALSEPTNIAISWATDARGAASSNDAISER